MSSNGDQLTYSCDDFMAFQDTLRKMRQIDDNIVHALNTTIPTESFIGERNKHIPAQKCESLWAQLTNNYRSREKAISKCVEISAEKLKILKAEREKNENSIEVLKRMRKEQTSFRLLENELSVEEILKERSAKVFSERCRAFYKPPVDGFI
jgi:hypothetical protein